MIEINGSLLIDWYIRSQHDDPFHLMLLILKTALITINIYNMYKTLNKICFIDVQNYINKTNFTLIFVLTKSKCVDQLGSVFVILKVSPNQKFYVLVNAITFFKFSLLFGVICSLSLR